MIKVDLIPIIEKKPADDATDIRIINIPPKANPIRVLTRLDNLAEGNLPPREIEAYMNIAK
jgi:hypothetical protein